MLKAAAAVQHRRIWQRAAPLILHPELQSLTKTPMAHPVQNNMDLFYCLCRFSQWEGRRLEARTLRDRIVANKRIKIQTRIKMYKRAKIKSVSFLPPPLSDSFIFNTRERAGILLWCVGSGRIVSPPSCCCSLEYTPLVARASCGNIAFYWDGSLG